MHRCSEEHVRDMCGGAEPLSASFTVDWFAACAFKRDTSRRCHRRRLSEVELMSAARALGGRSLLPAVVARAQ